MATDRSVNFDGTASTWDTTNWSDFFSASGYLLDGSSYAEAQGTNAGAVWDGDTFGDDQYSVIRCTQSATSLIGPVVRASGTSSGANGYFLGLDYTNQHYYLKKCINGSWTTIADGAATISLEPSAALYVVGSKLYGIIDGVLVVSATDTSIASGGYPGIFSESTPTNTFHRWRGGDIPEAGILAGWKNNGWATSNIGPGGSGGLVHWVARTSPVLRAGTVENIKFQINSWSSASLVRGAVYRVSDRALLGVTASTSISGLTVPGTITLPITTPFAVSQGDELILCWWCDAGYQEVAGVSEESVLLLSGQTYPTYPDPLPAYNSSSGSSLSEIYVTGTEAGGGPAVQRGGLQSLADGFGPDLPATLNGVLQ